MSKINTRSPYFISVTTTSITRAILDIYIYTGTQVATMDATTYSLDVDAYDSRVDFEISQLISDYLDITFNGSFDSQVVWVNYQLTEYISDVIQTPNAVVQCVAFDGYGYFEEGVNPQLSDKLLQTNTKIFVAENNSFYIPIQQDNLDTVTFINNSITQYYGDKITESVDVSNQSHYIEGSYSKAPSAITYTFSVYIKAAELSKITLRILGATGTGNARINFNTATQTLDASGASAGHTYVSSSYSDEGDGWYRVSLTATSTAESSLRVQVLLWDVSNSFNGYIGVGNGLYLRGMQLVVGSSPLGYSQTTSSTNTNLLLRSEDLSNPYWVKNFTTITEDVISVISTSPIMSTQTFTPTTNSGDVIRYVGYSPTNYIFQDTNDYLFQDANVFIFDNGLNNVPDEMLITYLDTSTESVYIETIDTCKYEPYRLTFINKFGALQDLWMFKRSDLTLNVESDNYRSYTYSNGTYDTSKHQYSNLNVSGKQSLSLNSGFYPELHNSVWTELVLSEKIWIYYNSKVLPVMLKSKELAYKTSLNDKLINYKLDFEFAFDTINSIY
jgi:hypothetical protein